MRQRRHGFTGYGRISELATPEFGGVEHFVIAKKHCFCYIEQTNDLKSVSICAPLDAQKTIVQNTQSFPFSNCSMKHPMITMVALITAQLASADPSLVRNEANREFYRLPMQFEPNVGQAAEAVKFLARGPGYTLLLTPAETVLSLQPIKSRRGESLIPQSELRVRLVGANESAQMEGIDQLPGVVNYFVGNDAQQWHPGIPTFSRVKYTQIYPGI